MFIARYLFVFVVAFLSPSPAGVRGVAGLKMAMPTAGSSGSTTTGISTAQIDISTAEDSDPSNPLMILGIHDDPTNADHSAAGVNYIVKINNHIFFSSTGDSDAAIS